MTSVQAGAYQEGYEAGRAEAIKQLIDDLRERTKMKYSGDCKCGQCQLVNIELLWAAILCVESLHDALPKDLCQATSLPRG